MVSSTGRFAFYSPDQYIPCLVQRSSKILVSFVEPPFQAATSAFVPRCLPSWKCPLESGHGRLKAELYESGQTREAAAGIRSNARSGGGNPVKRAKRRRELARPSQFEGLTGAKPFRISEGYPRVFTTEKGGGDLFWRDLGGLDPGRRLRGECDPSLVQ